MLCTYLTLQCLQFHNALSKDLFHGAVYGLFWKIIVSFSLSHTHTHTHTSSLLSETQPGSVCPISWITLDKYICFPTSLPLNPPSPPPTHTHTHKPGLCKLLAPAACNVILQQLAIRHYTALVH